MKMLPRHIWSSEGIETDTEKRGEALVFELLENIELSAGNVGLHSLNLIGDWRKAAFEIDFLVLTNRAYIGIEVKGGKVVCRDSKWYVYRDNGTVAYKKHQSPFVQAHEALHNLRTKWFPKTFGEDGRNARFAKLPFVPVSVLCMNPRPDYRHGSPPELPDEFTVYAEDLETERFKELLNHAVNEFMSARDWGPRTLLDQDLNEVATAIRPDLDFAYPSSSLLDSIESSQMQLTEEQYELVDQFASFDRLVIDGGAGTGKTFVILYAARAAYEQGRNVCILSQPLGIRKWLKEQLKDTNILVGGTEDLELANEDAFEILFVDEGQDLCNKLVMEQVERVLQGGIEHGQWRWFGDFKNQFAEGVEFDSEVRDLLLLYTGNNALFELRRNVRNTPNVVRWLEHTCRARVGETEVKGAGPEVQVIDRDELDEILSTNDAYFDFFGQLEKASATLLFPSAMNPKRRALLSKYGIAMSTIEEFKGLENSAIIVVGLEEMEDAGSLRDQVYKAVSRTRAWCLIEGSDEFKSRILRDKGLVNAK